MVANKQEILEQIQSGKVITTKFLTDIVEFVEAQKGPKGDTGAKGAKGDQGPKGDVGASIKSIILTKDADGVICKIHYT